MSIMFEKLKKIFRVVGAMNVMIIIISKSLLKHHSNIFSPNDTDTLLDMIDMIEESNEMIRKEK